MPFATPQIVGTRGTCWHVSLTAAVDDVKVDENNSIGILCKRLIWYRFYGGILALVKKRSLAFGKTEFHQVTVKSGQHASYDMLPSPPGPEYFIWPFPGVNGHRLPPFSFANMPRPSLFYSITQLPAPMRSAQLFFFLGLPLPLPLPDPPGLCSRLRTPFSMSRIWPVATSLVIILRHK